MIRIESVSQIHRMLGCPPPAHPLVSVIVASWQPPPAVPVQIVNERVSADLYTISLKRGCERALQYGRHPYDFQAGSMMFLAPGQSVMPLTDTSTEIEGDWGEGWTLVFHPDLLRGTALAERMSDCSFFGYDAHEALHLSDEEQATLTALVRRIEVECGRGLDAYTQEILVDHIQLILAYCKRYYARQFTLRSNANKDVIAKFERFLEDYWESDRPASEGLPSVQACARAMGYSPDYLSDLLRKETGKTTREHIQYRLIEKAKTRLLGSDAPISQIAYSLGFEHPQHFSKLFRSKTGMTPGAYRH